MSFVNTFAFVIEVGFLTKTVLVFVSSLFFDEYYCEYSLFMKIMN